VPDNVDETVALYRYWATLHDELVPFWYSLAREGAIMDTLGGAGDYRWTLGDAFLVAPLLDASGARDVELPDGPWHHWWQPTIPPIGATTLAVTMPERERIPLYVRDGAIVPVQVSSDVTGLGTAESADELTVLVWPSAQASDFTVIEEDGAETTITAADATITITGDPRPMIFRVRSQTTSQVMLDGADVTEAASRDEVLAATGDAWFHDGTWTWVRIAAAGGGTAFVRTP
jgi:alpha-D-xyloside xylohydrolase